VPEYAEVSVFADRRHDFSTEPCHECAGVLLLTLHTEAANTSKSKGDTN
jgi:hypothetical protein